MKKLLLVLLVVCLSGCTQTIQNDQLKNSQSIKQDDKQKVVEPEKKQLMDGIKQTMPEAVSYTHLDVYKRQQHILLIVIL